LGEEPQRRGTNGLEKFPKDREELASLVLTIATTKYLSLEGIEPDMNIVVSDCFYLHNSNMEQDCQNIAWYLETFLLIEMPLNKTFFLQICNSK
jgi:hypothetical protein